jgi:hypothetical protein
MDRRSQALAMSSIRAGIGLASIFAPGTSARVMGFPAGHDTATARLVGRLFGVRELLLAWLVVDALRGDESPPPSLFMTQAAVDAGDFAVQSWSVVRGEGIARGAAGGAMVAASAAVLWARLARRD